MALHDPRHQDVLSESPSVVAPVDLYQSEADLELLAVTDGLTVLIQKHGAPRILRLVRMLAHLAGQDVDNS